MRIELLGGEFIHIKCASGFLGREPETPYCTGYRQKYCPHTEPRAHVSPTGGLALPPPALRFGRSP
eukprot:1040463-Pyramimonas_sp.AAC.1